MRSAPPLDEPDSHSPPIPDSLPNPPNEGMLGGSAGRATGRAPKVLDGFGAGGATGRGAGAAARATGLGAAFGAAALAGARFGLAALRFAVVRLAVALLAPDRFAVDFFAVEPLAVDFLPPARLAVDRLAVDFFLVEDFFFAGIFPPSDARCRVRAWFMRMRPRCCYLRFIASALRKDKHFPCRASIADHAAGARSRIAASAEHLTLDPDDLGGASSSPIADWLHRVAALAQRLHDRLAEAGLEAQARIRTRSLATHRPARRIDSGLNRHATVDQVGDELQVGLDLPERPWRTADDLRPPVLQQHPGVQSVHRPLARRQPVRTVRVEAEAAHSVVEQDAGAAGHDTISGVEAVDIGHHVACLVDHAEIRRVRVSRRLLLERRRVLRVDPLGRRLAPFG